MRLALPEVCAGCGVSGAWICDECNKRVVLLDPEAVCQRCGHPSAPGQLACKRCEPWEVESLCVRSVHEFSGAMRQSILRMKYHGEYARARWHGAEMAQLVASMGWIDDVVVPVPLHPKRLRKRGYNQSEKLGDSIARSLGIEVVHALCRQRDTASQTTLGMLERRENVAGAFHATMSLEGASVLLVDDVTTTSSTLVECAQACLEAGATVIHAVTLATDV